jgi:outer membrane protein OmpA-like peptidoglycan-associated protein
MIKLPKSLAHTASRTAFLTLMSISLASAQSTKDDFNASKFDIDLGAGAQLFKQRPDPLETKLLNSKLFLIHFTENIWSHWSLEESLTGSSLADLVLLNPEPNPFTRKVDLELHVVKLSFNPVFHFTPNGSRVRPFLTAGFTEEIFSAADEGKKYAASLVPPAPFKSIAKSAFNYGGGVKVRFTDLLGMRIDVRGYWAAAPTFGLPGSPSVPPGALYIPSGGSLHGVDMTAGILFAFGGRKEAAPRPKPVEPTPAPAQIVTPAPAAPRVFELTPIQCSASTGYLGDAFDCSTSLNDSLHASTDKYIWTVDGFDQGTNSAQIKLTNLGVGAHAVKVSATDTATGTTATVDPYTITVNALPPLTVTSSAARSPIKFGETDALTAQGATIARCEPITYTWTTNIGSIQGTGPNVTFDSSTVQFDPANVFKPESRTATVTVTVSDKCGRSTTSAPIQIVINKDPKSMRLDDLVFGKGASRVNNCAKRILLDELQALMNNNPDVEVLLVGHIDSSESAKAGLDHQRVYNAAAVLTAGTGVCAKCDLSRIKVAFSGTDQTSDFRSGFCGTSTRQKSDERKADEIAADDAAAKNRRVEIWILPKGAPAPAGVTNPEPAPEKIIKAKGCPH